MGAVGRGAQGSLQVGPEQLLAAAQRAEADGRRPYAMQIYHQLAEAFPTTREAYDARDALMRLSIQASEEQAQHAHAGPPAGHAHPMAPPGPQHGRAPPTLSGGGAVARPSPRSHAPHGDGQPMTAPRREAPRRSSAASAPMAHPPQFDAASGYRLGRLVAMTLTSMGWMLLLLAVVALMSSVAALTIGAVPRPVREFVVGQLPLVMASTAGTFLLALLVLFAGQAARAMFETADAVRYLLARSDNDGA